MIRTILLAAVAAVAVPASDAAATADALIAGGERWLITRQQADGALVGVPRFRIGITALAACSAWVAAILLGISAPVPAAGGAVITVALSLNRSLRTGLSLVGATAVALLVAFALYQWWGLHVWTVGVLVVVSLAIGRLMRLGPEGSLQIPVTALFVYFMGEALTDDVIVTRIVATLLGVAVGLVFSFVAHPERPEERMTEKLSELGGRLGSLLVAMGHISGDQLTRRQATEWLTEARTSSVPSPAASMTRSPAESTTKTSFPVPPTIRSSPAPPSSVSLPAAPLSVFAAEFPMSRFASAFPEPEIESVPARTKCSTLSDKTCVIEEWTVSVPDEASSTTRSPASSIL